MFLKEMLKKKKKGKKRVVSHAKNKSNRINYFTKSILTQLVGTFLYVHDIQDSNLIRE